MNFFKKNTGITVSLIVTILLSGWLFWENSTVQAEIDDLTESLESQKNTAEELKEKEYAITEENKNVSEKNLDSIKSRIGDIKSALTAYNIKTNTMHKVEFQSHLHATVDQLKKDLTRKGISVNQKFQELSFSKIKEIGNPSPEQIKTGLTRLQVIKKVVEMLPETKEISPLKEIGIESIESINWPEKGNAVSKSGTITYTPFEIRLIGNQDAVRPFINKIVSCDDIFMVIRSIEFNNPVTFELPKPDTQKKPAGSTAKTDEKVELINYKENREIVNNNKVDWKLYIDLIQTCDAKPTEEMGE